MMLSWKNLSGNGIARSCVTITCERHMKSVSALMDELGITFCSHVGIKQIYKESQASQQTILVTRTFWERSFLVKLNLPVKFWEAWFWLQKEPKNCPQDILIWFPKVL